MIAYALNSTGWTNQVAITTYSSSDVFMTLKTESQQDPWDNCLQSLLTLRDLDDDWDGEGSRRPNTHNVETAIAWVTCMRSQIGSASVVEKMPEAMKQSLPFRYLVPPFAPEVMPGTDGEISLIWRTQEEYLEAEINEPGHFEWMSIKKGQQAKFCSNHGELPTKNDWTS
jgi:hypothetical protein